jgi:hypothetical protein
MFARDCMSHFQIHLNFIRWQFLIHIHRNIEKDWSRESEDNEACMQHGFKLDTVDSQAK